MDIVVLWVLSTLFLWHVTHELQPSNLWELVLEEQQLFAKLVLTILVLWVQYSRLSSIEFLWIQHCLRSSVSVKEYIFCCALYISCQVYIGHTPHCTAKVRLAESTSQHTGSMSTMIAKGKVRGYQQQIPRTLCQKLLVALQTCPNNPGAWIMELETASRSRMEFNGATPTCHFVLHTWFGSARNSILCIFFCHSWECFFLLHVVKIFILLHW